jgi:hypothetical protein
MPVAKMLLAAAGALFAVPWLAVQGWAIWSYFTSPQPVADDCERSDMRAGSWPNERYEEGGMF